MTTVEQLLDLLCRQRSASLTRTNITGRLEGEVACCVLLSVKGSWEILCKYLPCSMKELRRDMDSMTAVACRQVVCDLARRVLGQQRCLSMAELAMWGAERAGLSRRPPSNVVYLWWDQQATSLQATHIADTHWISTLAIVSSCVDHIESTRICRTRSSTKQRALTGIHHERCATGTSTIRKPRDASNGDGVPSNSGHRYWSPSIHPKTTRHPKFKRFHHFLRFKR